MKLTIFESDMGDCLLLEAKSGELVLCDGGMRSSMTTHVRSALSALRDAGRELALVYISHIDNDHVNGILQLLEDEAEWRVFDLHADDGDPIRPPRVPRPPVIRGLLHNAFRDQVTANNRRIESLLVAAAPALYASAIPGLIRAADEMQGIATGIPEALKIAKLVGSDALNIPVNAPPGVVEGQKLLLAGRPGERFTLGSMQFTLLGPTKKELTALRKGWNTWLRENPDRVRRLRAELKRRIEEFSAGTLSSSPYDLSDWNGVPDLDGVTAPNVASLMFMVEEDEQTVLLTGDGHHGRILEGLERTGLLDAGALHVDVLKVQHHGSEHNLDEEFARTVSADHYVLCGNGSHGNPEIEVLDRIIDSRIGSASRRARAPEAADRDFHLWFSTTSAAAEEGLVRRETFAAIESHVAERAVEAQGRMHLHFNEGASIELEI